MMIRKAEEKDIPRINELLGQVLQIHADIRPDIFIPGTTKYTVNELSELLKNEEKPIYVAVDEEKYSFEYYFMKGEDSADVVYQYAVSNLSNTYDGVDDATILEDENNSVADYSISASDYYCEVLKKENTVLYVTAYHDYELEAKKIIDELGY